MFSMKYQKLFVGENIRQKERNEQNSHTSYCFLFFFFCVHLLRNKAIN